MDLQVKKHTDTAKLPKRARRGDLGYDLFADEGVMISPGERELVSTGISLFTTSYKWGFIIKDRSSMAMKGLFSHAGVIDSGYTGEVKVLLYNSNDTSYEVRKGDKIAQLIPTKVVDFEITETDKLFETERGSKGFGSTGR